MNPADRLQALEDMLRHALQQVHVLRLKVIAGDATFEQAAETVRDLAECLATFQSKPAFRYFADRGWQRFWKIAQNDDGFTRGHGDEKWDYSVCGLSDIIGDPEIKEITPEEGEP